MRLCQVCMESPRWGERTCLLPRPQMGWTGFSPCVHLVGLLGLKPQESGGGISSRSEKHPSRRNLGCSWHCEVPAGYKPVHCHTSRHNPALHYSPRRTQDQLVSVPTLVSVHPNYECHRFCCSCSLEFGCRPNVYGGKHDYLQSQALMMVIIMTAIVGRACNYVDSSFYCTYNNKPFYLRVQGSRGKMGHLFH